MIFLSLMHMQRVCQATTYTNTLTHKHNKWLTEAQVLSHHSWQDLCWWNQWRETHKGKIKVSEERNDIFWTHILILIPSLTDTVFQSLLASAPRDSLPRDQYQHNFQDQTTESYLERAKSTYGHWFPIRTEREKNILFHPNFLAKLDSVWSLDFSFCISPWWEGICAASSEISV